MSLTILDENKQPLVNGLQTVHNGFTGGADEVLFYIKNLHQEYYYTHIKLEVLMPDLATGEIFTTSGWSIKLKYGSEQPTDKEWGDILVNNEIPIPDIGNNLNSETTTYHPIWIRVFCPGHTNPKIRQDMKFKLKYLKKLVGDNG